MLDNENDLVHRWRKGDRSAFEALARHYMPSAYLTALGFTRNPDDAMDISQEAFLKAYRARGRFQEGRPFWPWFYRILRNRCLNFVQRESAKHEPLCQEDDPGDERFSAESPSPLELLEEEERRKLLHAAIERLSFEHREVIVLKSFEGYTYQQIAETLEIPIGTVMSRLYYARKMLKEILVRMWRSRTGERKHPISQTQTARGEVV